MIELIIFIELSLIMPFLFSYGTLIEHIYEYKKLDPSTRHIYRFGEVIKWWYYLPFGHLFCKANY